ncbi:unnamed protein product [Linum trigynum]|uniref:Uncharacterized protein n=1 Tax=Linum trigynum TaxID=586398 RepID=A0AAV2E0I7_9ROSI
MKRTKVGEVAPSISPSMARGDRVVDKQGRGEWERDCGWFGQSRRRVREDVTPVRDSDGLGRWKGKTLVGEEIKGSGSSRHISAKQMLAKTEPLFIWIVGGSS